MVDAAVTLPEPRPGDDEDVVWGLSTAAALWARGEHGDAIVWLRRAADAASAAGQEQRATEIGVQVVRIEHARTEAAAAPAAVAPSPSEAPKAAGAMGEAPKTPTPGPLTPEGDRVSGSYEEIDVEPVPPPPPLPPKAGTIRPPAADASLFASLIAPKVPHIAAVTGEPAAQPAASPPKSVFPPKAAAPVAVPPIEAPSPPKPAVDPKPPAEAAPAPRIPAVEPAKTARTPSIPPPPAARPPAPSSYPGVRKTAGPRVPILDPWAEEPSSPNLRLDALRSAVQVQGDEVVVQMRRGAPRATDEDDVVTSAAPLDTTLRRGSQALAPPARKWTATGEQPPGHIADAGVGVIAKGPPPVPTAPGPGAARPPAAPASPGSPTESPTRPIPQKPAPPAPAAAEAALAPPPADPAAAAPPPPEPRRSAVTVPSFMLSKAKSIAPPGAPPATPLKMGAPPAPAIPAPARPFGARPSTPPPAASPEPSPPINPADVPTMPTTASPIPRPRRPSVPPAGPPPGVVAPKATAPTLPVVPAPSPPTRPPPAPPRPTGKTAPPPPPAHPDTPKPAAKPASTPPAPPSPGAVGSGALDNVSAFADVPAEMRALLVARGRVATLGPDDEITGFAAALVVEGAVAVCATIVDEPIAHATLGTVVPTSGTFPGGVALRVVAGPGGARVAVWEQAVLDEALHAVTWVLEELKAEADRLQALAGATMGPLGDLDEALRERVLSRLSVRAAPARAEVDIDPAVALVCAGSVEVLTVGAEAPVLVRTGEALLPRADIREARAGAQGALLLVGDAFPEDLAADPTVAALFAKR